MNEFEYNESMEDEVLDMDYVLDTERLVLYPMSALDLRALYLDEQNMDLKKAYFEMLTGCMDHPDQHMFYTLWMMEEKEDGLFIGNLCFKGLNPDGTVEIGYGVDEEYRNNGYCTEAVRAMTKWALSQEGVSSVEAETEPANTASLRVLEKAGFIRNGKEGEEGPRFTYKG